MVSRLPSPRVEVRHLRLVSAIVTLGSLTAASRALGLTQPALSHQLRELETALRAPLFIRTARRLIATPAGERLFSLAQSVLGQMDGFEREVFGGALAQTRGTLRLATECYTAYHWLPGVFSAFRERWHDVEIRIAPEHTDAPVAALREGSLDLAIIHRRVADKRIRLHPLFDDELVVVTSPSHPFARRPFVAEEDLCDQHLMLYVTADGDSAVLRDLLDPAGVTPAQLTRIQLTEAIISLVSADIGISVLARWAVAPAIRAGVVAATRLTEHGFSRRWSVATRATEPTPAYQFDFIELLRRNVAAGPVVRVA